MNSKIGTLYGIGVGPGDPDLITLKASKILKTVDVVFAASSTKNSHSLAVGIARCHIPEATPVLRLSFPMTTDPDETEKAWCEHATTIYESLDTGKDVAFLTLGDPMTYSTFGYILRCLKDIEPKIPVEIVPGITSYQAAAARLNTPLVEGEESLLVVSGANGGDRLRQIENKPETVVFLKAYRNVQDITQAIDEANTQYHPVAIARCSQPEEEIINDMEILRNRRPEYWTLIIAKQKK